MTIKRFFESDKNKEHSVCVCFGGGASILIDKEKALKEFSNYIVFRTNNVQEIVYCSIKRGF